MKINIVATITYTLISIIIFSLVFSNSYALFIDKQDQLFIEDVVVVKVLNGNKFDSVESVVDHLDDEAVSYVMYYKEENVFYVKKNDYANMLNLEMNGDEVASQEIGKYQYRPLNRTSNQTEVFIAVKNYNEEQMIELFISDGAFGLKNLGYDGMMTTELYIILLMIIIVINYLFLYLFLYVNNEKIGVMKLLGYDSKIITKNIVRQIIFCFLISMVFVYIINFEYINYMFKQSFVFRESLNLLLIYVASIILTTFISGAITYVMVEKKTAIEYIREVTYD